MSKQKKSKLKLITRTFLAANKPKKYTANGICEFINTNNLNVNVTPIQLGKIIDSKFCYKYGITRERKNTKDVYHYNIER